MRPQIATGITLRAGAGAALIAAIAFAVFVAAPAVEPAGRAPSDQPVTILATWTGPEEKDFTKVLKGFEQNHPGIHVDYTGTRALDQVLASDIQRGNPPDLVILSSPVTLLQYANEGYLKPLGPVIGKLISAYGPQWQDIMRLGTNKLYTLPIKTQVHNLVWYDPQHWPAGAGFRPEESTPPTWSQLIALDQHITASGGTPWCVGLDSTPVSGWPATDWIGDILLHQAGTADYGRWANGRLPWTSPQVEAAWKAWGMLVTGRGQVYGGSKAALVTGWDKAGKPMFNPRPGCYLQHVPSFITLSYHGIDFFPFPMYGLPGERQGAQTWEVSADLLAMFNDTPDAELLVRYLAMEKAQKIWPFTPGGGAISANLQVLPKKYPDPVAQAIAGIVTGPTTLCFNASDEMPDTLQSAFYQEVMDYLQDPGQLDTILKRLDQLRKTTYQSFHPNFSCGSQ